jgi:hypothetical protein
LKNYKVWERSLRDFLYRTQNYLVYECNELKDAFSRPGETRGEFLVRLETLISEHRDQETEKLRSKFATRFQKARNEIDKLQLMKDREAAQYKSKRLESILDVGSSIMGALLGRKSRRRVSTTARNINNTAEQRTDVLIAEEKHTNAVNAYKDLDVEFNKAMNDLHEKLQTSNVVLTETLIPPRKTDIKIERFCVCWVPYFRDEYGNMELAH